LAFSSSRQSELGAFAAELPQPWRFVGSVNAVARDGLRDGLPIHASLRYERGKRCDGDMTGADLEKTTKRRTRVLRPNPSVPSAVNGAST
jgi:hypothetical protein